MTLESSEQPVVFGHVMDGTFRAFGERLSPAGREALLRLGMGKPIPDAAPLHAWVEVLTIIGRDLFGQLPPRQQALETGRTFSAGYFQTPLGQSLLEMGRSAGLRGLLLRLGRDWTNIGNYLEVESRDHGEREVELRMALRPQFVERWGGLSSVLFPYRHGVILALFAALDVQTGQVEVVESDEAAHRIRFIVRW